MRFRDCFIYEGQGGRGGLSVPDSVVTRKSLTQDSLESCSQPRSVRFSTQELPSWTMPRRVSMPKRSYSSGTICLPIESSLSHAEAIRIKNENGPPELTRRALSES